jgi:hypothetical protein
MGGNLFKEAERIPADLYEVIVAGVHWNPWAYIPASVDEKESFGDVDILVDASGPDQFAEVVNAFLAKEKVLAPIEKDNQSWHALVDCAGVKCQFDFIKHFDSDTLNFAIGYFSYNDLGNLIGRIAHRQGFKFGHDGLWWTYRDGDLLVQDIKLTNDYDEATNFLGFGRVPIEGFATFDEMFEWVRSCSRFEYSAFPLEHRNHRSRVRDAKRKTYNMFLDWLSTRYNLLDYHESDKDYQGRRLKEAFVRWPKARDEFQTAFNKHTEDQHFKTKFNGDIVREITGQEGKALGLVCQRMKQTLSRDWILKAPQADINQAIAALFVAFKI